MNTSNRITYGVHSRIRMEDMEKNLNRKDSMYIELKGSAGEYIEDLSYKAKDIAEKLSIDCHFEFNGVTCVMNPNGNPQKLAKEVLRRIKDDRYSRCTSINIVFSEDLEDKED